MNFATDKYRSFWGKSDKKVTAIFQSTFPRFLTIFPKPTLIKPKVWKSTMGSLLTNNFNIPANCINSHLLFYSPSGLAQP